MTCLIHPNAQEAHFGMGRPVVCNMGARHKTKEAAVKYRILKDGEKIRKGDEWFSDIVGWNESNNYPGACHCSVCKSKGHRVGYGGAHFIYRRPIKAKSAHTANNNRKGKIARKKKQSKRATSPNPASKLKDRR